MSLSGSKRRYSAYIGSAGSTPSQSPLRSPRMSYYGSAASSQASAAAGAAAGAVAALSQRSRGARLLSSLRSSRSKKMPYGAGGGMVVTRNAGTPLYISPSATNNACASVASSFVTTLPALNTGIASGGLITGLTDLCFSMYFRAQDVTNWSDFVALFDQYRIKKVQLVFRMTGAATSAAPAATNILTNPTVCWIEDYDDGNIPSGPDALRERMGLKMKQLLPGRGVVVNVRPKCLASFYPGGVSTSSAAAGVPGKAPWLDIVQGTIPHFGIKGFFKELDLRGVTAPGYQISVEAKYTLEFRNVK